MQIIVKKVGEPHEVRTIETLELEDMQELVGGLIECFHVGNGVDMWLNDMGKLIDLPLNIAIGSQDKRVLDTIHGDVFFRYRFLTTISGTSIWAVPSYQPLPPLYLKSLTTTDASPNSPPLSGPSISFTSTCSFEKGKPLELTW